MRPPAFALDLGSGGGVPGLVLAVRWPTSRWLLLDAAARRAAFLAGAVDALGLADRVAVRCERAEVSGRDPTLRHTFDLVTARGFAGPAVTAECAAPFLAEGGHLVCADPPGAPDDRWPSAGLAELGLETAEVVPSPVAVRRLRVVRPCSDRFPRRTGIPGKRPLF